MRNSKSALTGLLAFSLSLVCTLGFGQDVFSADEPKKELKVLDTPDGKPATEVKVVWTKSQTPLIGGADSKATIVVTDLKTGTLPVIKGWTDLTSSLDVVNADTTFVAPANTFVSNVWYLKLSGPELGQQIVTSQVGMRHIGSYINDAGNFVAVYATGPGAGLQLQKIPGAVVHVGGLGSYSIGASIDTRLDNLPADTLVAVEVLKWTKWVR
jgi:hypothetical protein